MTVGGQTLSPLYTLFSHIVHRMHNKRCPNMSQQYSQWMINTRPRDVIQHTCVRERKSGGEDCCKARVRRWLTELSLNVKGNSTHRHQTQKHNLTQYK
jgi:hypothetical protein